MHLQAGNKTKKAVSQEDDVINDYSIESRVVRFEPRNKTKKAVSQEDDIINDYSIENRVVFEPRIH